MADELYFFDNLPTTNLQVKVVTCIKEIVGGVLQMDLVNMIMHIRGKYIEEQFRSIFKQLAENDQMIISHSVSIDSTFPLFGGEI